MTTADGAVVGDANGKFVTDSAGTFLVDNIDPNTTLVVKESRTKPGYLLDNTAQTAQIRAGQTVTLEFRNQPLGTLIIQKYSSLDRRTPLAGVQFKVVFASGCVVDDENGKISSSGIYYTGPDGTITIKGIVGTVVVTEQATIPGYTIDPETRSQTVVVNPDDTQTLTVYNEPLCSLTLTKKDAITGKPVPNTEFTLKDGNGGVIGRYTTESDGTVTVTGLIPNSTVVVVESKVPSNYVLDPTPRTIIVRNGANSSVITGTTGGGTGSGGNGGNDLTIENVPKTTLTIEKYLETESGNQPLKGVTFLVVDSSGAVIGPDNGEYTTDENLWCNIFAL